VWFALKTHGSSAFERGIRANLEQARHLVARIEREPRLELLAPVPLNVVNLRYRTQAARGGTALDLDALNRELLVRLQEGGVAVPSQTVLAGRFALRVAITNHRTSLADLDLMVDEVLRLGDALAREAAAARAPSWIPSPTTTTRS
jgi:glutamate/tyrosine decarboxylase-like PLP-dependent enzyme